MCLALAGCHGHDAANNELLLAQLADVPDGRRGAAFVSACALVRPGEDSGPGGVPDSCFTPGPDGAETVEEGRWSGTILRAPRGEGGFGYEPLFLPEGAHSTAAELSPQENDAPSHRGRSAGIAPACALARRATAGLTFRVVDPRGRCSYERAPAFRMLYDHHRLPVYL